jgi:hypothetical protein
MPDIRRTIRDKTPTLILLLVIPILFLAEAD